MRARDPREAHRAATPLELLYDLCFVVAIAQAASSLHHALSHGEGWHAMLPFVMVFFAIWWAWMNFTWFASAYDTDDVPYRVKVLLQMTGLLVLAAGVPRGFEEQDFRLMTFGYTIMRVGMIAQWLRAARANPDCRRTAHRYALGITLCQIIWLSLLLLPVQGQLIGWSIFVPAELLVPIWAERAGATRWHPEHIAERYGLMTIIVIGESVLAATLAIQSALDAGHPSLAFWELIVSAPVILFAMWWLYFERPQAADERTSWKVFAWGYGHYFVFAAAAATGAGLAVNADLQAHTAELSVRSANLALAVPVTLYLLAVWISHLQRVTGYCTSYLLAAAFTLVSAWLPATPLLIAATLAALTTWEVARGSREAT